MHLAGSTAPLDADRRRMARLIHDAGSRGMGTQFGLHLLHEVRGSSASEARGLKMASE